MREKVFRIRAHRTILIRHAAVAFIVSGFTVLLYVTLEVGQDSASVEPGHKSASVVPRHWLALSEIACFNGVRVMTVANGGLGSDRDSAIVAEPPNGENLQFYLRLLETELAVYTAETIKKIGVRKVVLCGTLQMKGEEIGGVALSDRGTLFLTVVRSPSDSSYARGAIHHEIFHMIDFHDGYADSDYRWERLNAKGFRYGKGGIHHLDNGYGLLPDDSVMGFLNKYSRSGAEEDKAEIYEFMLNCPGILEERMSRDAILSAKYRELRSRLKKSLPEMDEVFSARMREREVRIAVRRDFASTRPRPAPAARE
jgi:hypothetical protein